MPPGLAVPGSQLCEWEIRTWCWAVCLALKGHLWVDLQRQSSGQYCKAMTIHEREAAKKRTVPVLKTWSKGFTCIYTWIKKKGERRKSGRKCWRGGEGKTQDSNHTIPLPHTLSIKNHVFDTGEVGSGLTSSLLASGFWHFGQLAVFG